MQRCQENVCLPCRDPDAPCDEITEALINLLMDAMLSQNLLHALDHFCANHKIVPEFTSIPSTGNMMVAHVDGDWWSPCWTTEGGGGMSMCAYMWRLGDMLRPIHLWSAKTPSGLSRRGSCRGIPRRNIVTSVR